MEKEMITVSYEQIAKHAVLLSVLAVHEMTGKFLSNGCIEKLVETSIKDLKRGNMDNVLQSYDEFMSI